MTSKHYEIIIYWSEADAAFVAEVPKLPGCMADGTTYEQALKNAQSTMHDWIETATQLNRPVPAPRGRLMFA